MPIVGLVTFLAAGVWSLTIGFFLVDIELPASLSQVISAIGLAYIVLSPAFLLPIRRIVQFSSALSVSSVAITAAWGALFTGYGWPVILLLLLQAVGGLLSTLAWRRKREVKRGTHPLDLPVFG